MMSSCCRTGTPLLIQGRMGSEEREHISICSDCGEIKVFADFPPEKCHYTAQFRLSASGLLLAASQAYRHLETGLSAPQGRVARPLDFGGMRLYEVRLFWERRDGARGKEYYYVVADSPNQTAHSAANLIKNLLAPIYDSDPMLVYWTIRGYPMNVLQPAEWVENGVRLLDERMLVICRKLAEYERLSQNRAGAIDEDASRVLLDEAIRLAQAVLDGGEGAQHPK